MENLKCDAPCYPDSMAGSNNPFHSTPELEVEPISAAKPNCYQTIYTKFFRLPGGFDPTPKIGSDRSICELTYTVRWLAGKP